MEKTVRGTSRTQQHGERPPGWHSLLPIVILLGAFWLFCHYLTAEGLWRDEGLSVARASQPILQIFKNQNMVQGMVTPDLHPPGYFLMLKATMALIGDSEFALRIPSVFGALLAMVTVGRLAAECATGKPHLAKLSTSIGMLTVGTSPFLFWYAREARMYGWLMFGVALCYWLFVRLLKKPTKPADWVPLVLAIGLIAATHVSAVFVIGYLLLALILFTSGRLRQLFLLVLGLAVGAFALFAFTDWGNTLLTTRFAFFAPRPLSQLLAESVTTFSMGGAGPPETVWPLFIPILLAAVLGGIAPFLTAQAARWPVLAVTVLGFFGPLFLFFGASFVQPGYSNPRHLTILAVPWLLLVSLGPIFLLSKARWLGLLAAVGVALIGANGIFLQITDPPIVKDQFREMNAFFSKRALPGDLLVFHQPALTVPWDYYDVAGLEISELPLWEQPLDVAWQLEDFKRNTAETGRIWFVDSLKRDGNIEDWLNSGWQPQQTTIFAGSWEQFGVTLYLPADEKPPTGTNLLDRPMQAGSLTFTHLAPQNRATSGQHSWVNAVWGGPQNGSSACLRVEELDGEFVTESCALARPAPVGENTVTFDLDLPPGLQKGDYQLRLRGDGQLSDPVPFGITPVTLSASDALWQDGDLLAFEPQFVGETFLPGTWINVNAVWQSAAGEQSIDTVWRLADRWGNSVAETEQSAVVGTQATRQSLRFFLPPDQVERFRLQLRQPNGRWRTLSALEVTPWPFETELDPAAEAPAQPHLFADGISLAGSRVERRGNELDVIFYWQADQKPADDWVVFIHVGEAGQPPVAQTANRPAGANRATIGWRPGEIIQDKHTLVLPDGLTAAESNIFVGMWLASDGNVRAPLSVSGTPKADGLLPIGEVPGQ